MLNQYLKAFRKYIEFNGRASRKEFWLFSLSGMLLVFALFVATYISARFFTSLPVVYLPVAVLAAHLLPALSVLVRRIHDTGQSGWTALFGLIPVFGFFILLIIALRGGDPGPNKFGPAPMPEDTPPAASIQ